MDPPAAVNQKGQINHESTKERKNENPKKRQDDFRAFTISCFRDKNIRYKSLR
jgi:hypothetical protein